MRLPRAFVIRIGDINEDGDASILAFAHLYVGILKAAGPCLAQCVLDVLVLEVQFLPFILIFQYLNSFSAISHTFTIQFHPHKAYYLSLQIEHNAVSYCSFI